MAYRGGNRSALDAYLDLDILTAAALMFFAVVGLVMTGLAGDVVEMLNKHQYLPLAMSFIAYALVFASSGTRNPQHYHPAEWVFVSMTGILMIAHAFLSEVQTLIANNDPAASVVIMFFMVVTGAILSK